MNLAQLVQQVPAETEKRVDKTRQRFNAIVRAILREETGLRLNFNTGSDTAEGGGRDAVSVPIAVVPGVPLDANAGVVFDDVDELALLLGRHRTTLESLASAATGAAELIRVLANRQLLAAGDPPETAVRESGDWAAGLLAQLGKADPLRKILDFREDILGRYRFQVPVFDERRAYWSEDRFRGEIDLYWGVVGLVAELLNCTVEDLTIVVLAHELAHAYTHIGADIDGARWASAAFAASEVELKEGLAQYYTERVCVRLRDRAPGCLDAYQELLKRQPSAYLVHVKWMKQGTTPESVRLAMLAARRKSLPGLEQFEQLLVDAGSRLSRNIQGASDQKKLFEE